MAIINSSQLSCCDLSCKINFMLENVKRFCLPAPMLLGTFCWRNVIVQQWKLKMKKYFLRKGFVTSLSNPSHHIPCRGKSSPFSQKESHAVTFLQCTVNKYGCVQELRSTFYSQILKNTWLNPVCLVGFGLVWFG